MLTEADDYRAECRSLYELLADTDLWDTPTLFKGWTPHDVIGHLHLSDVAAQATLRSREEFGEFVDHLKRARVSGRSPRDYTRDWLADLDGPALLERWFAFSGSLCEFSRDLDPKSRIAWWGPDMSVRSCMTARQMETWAHGQAIFDMAGRVRTDQDRIKNVAVMGMNTFNWAFQNRGLTPPLEKPYVRLIAPSGTIWEWNEAESANAIRGSATGFCQVVAQTRNVADTDLHVAGSVATAWMSIAQCFAGPPNDPPAPGSRHIGR
jgi:uncharacterized protein (TIGR03084 family)